MGLDFICTKNAFAVYNVSGYVLYCIKVYVSGSLLIRLDYPLPASETALKEVSI